jgi:protein involved in polysaccharide export with SLBB domain
MNGLAIRARKKPAWSARGLVAVLSAAPALLSSGCYSLLNGWLDPTTVGNYSRQTTTEIRSSLTLEDTPGGIPGAVNPSPGDLLPVTVEYPITAGDTLAIEINELRQRQVAYQTQSQVSAAGYVNLPVVGKVPAADLTVPEFEQAIVDALRARNVLVDPEVTVNPLFLQKATYSIFGIGVSAANNAPLRAGTFPIRRPDLRLLEAINQVGGLNEFVTEIYIFRDDAALNDERTKTPQSEPSPSVPQFENGGAPRNHKNGNGRDAGNEALQSPVAPQQAARQELLEAVESGIQPTRPEQQPEEKPPAVPESLEPEKPEPFIYVNKEFVPNPSYREQPPTSSAQNGSAFDTVMPAVNWARLAGESTFRILIVPAEALRSGDPSVNIYVRAGDVIRVVSGEIGIYYVMGQVNRVGPFAFNAEQITLKAAIAAAGGLSGLAWPDRCTVYRRLGQREQMIQVDLDRIFAGADPDFMIRRGDIINVGTHPFAPFLQRIRALSLPNPVTNVGYSFTYARNFADIDSFAVRQNPHNQPGRFENLFP